MSLELIQRKLLFFPTMLIPCWTERWKLLAVGPWDGGWNNSHMAREDGDVVVNHSGHLSCKCHHSFTALSPHKPSTSFLRILHLLFLTFVSCTSCPFLKSHQLPSLSALIYRLQTVLPIHIPGSDTFKTMYTQRWVSAWKGCICTLSAVISCR